VPVSVFPCFWVSQKRNIKRSPIDLKISRRLFLDQKKSTEHRRWTWRVPSQPRGWRAHPTPWARPLPHGWLGDPSWLVPDANTSYISPNFQNRTKIGSSAAASLCSHQKPIRTLFWHPVGGGIHHRWLFSSSRRSPWWGGSSSPLGPRVCTSSYVFDLSLSLVFLIWHDLDVLRALLL